MALPGPAGLAGWPQRQRRRPGAGMVTSWSRRVGGIFRPPRTAQL